ncbi:MAG: MerR family DNA-binding transcriptional regulator [Acidimicrobiia bacterium]
MTTSTEPRPRRRGGDDLLSIGQLAQLTGVSSRTIRYYEELGILPEPHRSPGGTRKYTREHRFYVEGALALKDLGFRLEEIELIGRIALGEQIPAEQRARVAELVRGNMAALEHRIKVLHRLREILLDEAAGVDAVPGDGDGLSRLAGLMTPPATAG